MFHSQRENGRGTYYGSSIGAYRFRISCDVEEDSEWGCWDMTEICFGTPEHWVNVHSGNVSIDTYLEPLYVIWRGHNTVGRMGCVGAGRHRPFT